MLPWHHRSGLILALALGVLVACAHAWLTFKLRPSTLGDPDRYYHYAVSKIYADQGPPTQIPQAEDVRWNQAFPEKEFLFHVLTGVGYRLGGDRGVEMSVYLVSGLTILSLFVLAVSLTNPINAAAIMVLIAGSGIELFYYRLVMIRPQVLAIFCFVWILFAAIKQRPRLMLVSCLAFALAYHGLQAPLLVIGLVMISGIWNNVSWRNTAICGLAGLLIGVLANPYFPYNISVMLQHLQIAVGGAPIPLAHFGGELHPWRTDFFLKRALVYFALALFAVWFLRRRVSSFRGEQSGVARQLSYQWLLAVSVFGAFMLASLLSPRAFEYAVPASVAVIALISVEKFWWLIVGPLLAMGSARGLINILPEWSAKANAIAEVSGYERVHEALQAVPKGDRGTKIVNTEWDTAPFILYDRPDLRFTGLLDPTFLYRADKELFNRLSDLLSGRVPDPFGLIKDVFKADYVISRNSDVAFLLSHDPNFTMIYPKKRFDFLGYWVFSIGQTQRSESVTKLRAYSFPVLKRGDAWPEKPLDKAVFVDWPFEEWRDLKIKPTFMHLQEKAADLKALKKSLANTSTSDESEKPESPRRGRRSYCAQIEPDPTEVARLEGAEILAIGGGPHIRAWRNGRLILTTQNAVGLPRLVNLILNLDQPLVASDKLQVIVCSDDDDSSGVALSLWRRADMKKLCESNGSAGLMTQPTMNDSFVGSDWQPLGCLAPFAIKPII